MAAITDLGLVLHRIRIKLYPNYFQNAKGSYIARTNNEKTLSIEDVCTALKTRGGFTGNYEDMLEYIRQYNDEIAYQLCDGYAVTNGYYTVHPNIGGTFNSVNEAHDHVRHPISFRFSIRSKLRKLISNISVDIEGIADTQGFIDSFVDYEEKSTNNIFIPGNQFAIHGSKIKVAGDDPACGIYFVPVDDPSKAVKVTRIAKNNPSEVTGIAPDTSFTNNRIQIRTQYSGNSTTFLKTTRIINSVFVIEAA
ncbi:MAG: DUF4469 domain-containing protein [Treponema sp.]|jgi:hypothetical protein|nr:DUF4469 domain-containing protein [Treponema sp.]